MSDRFRIPSIVFVPVMAAALFLPKFLAAQTQSASAAKPAANSKTLTSRVLRTASRSCRDTGPTRLYTSAAVRQIWPMDFCRTKN